MQSSNDGLQKRTRCLLRNNWEVIGKAVNKISRVPRASLGAHQDTCHKINYFRSQKILVGDVRSQKYTEVNLSKKTLDCRRIHGKQWKNIRGPVVRPLWRAVAPGLKTLSLPRAQNETSSCPGILSRTLRFVYVASSPASPLPHLLDGHRKLVGSSVRFAIQYAAKETYYQYRMCILIGASNVFFLTFLLRDFLFDGACPFSLWFQHCVQVLLQSAAVCCSMLNSFVVSCCWPLQRVAVIRKSDLGVTSLGHALEDARHFSVALSVHCTSARTHSWGHSLIFCARTR